MSGSCEFCAERGWDHQEVADLTQTSLYWFTYYFVSDWVSPGLHKVVCDWYQKKVAAGHNRFLIMLPRGHLKTTTFTIGLPIFWAKDDPDERVGLMMNTTQVASEKLLRLEDVLLSPAFRHFYGHLVPDKTKGPTASRWNRTECNLVRPIDWEDATFTAMGADKSKTGKHFTRQVLDDLVDGMAEDSAIQMRNAVGHLERCEGYWVNRNQDHQLIVGTFWPGGPDGYYEQIVAMKEYTKVVMGCYVDERYRRFMTENGVEVVDAKDGEPIYERETKESLDRAKVFFKGKFVHQMLNLPYVDQFKRFKKEDCKYYHWTDGKSAIILDGETQVPISTMYRQLTIDPATGVSANTDESAIVVTGWIRGLGVAVVLDVWADRVLINELCDIALNMAEKWKVHVMRPEVAAGLSAFDSYLRDAMIKSQRHFPVDPVRPGIKSKAVRIIENLQGYVANQQIRFRRDQPAIIHELTNLVIWDNEIRGRSPNMVDALAYHPEYWMRNPPIRNTDEIRYEEPNYAKAKVDDRPRYGLFSRARQLARQHIWR